MFERMKQGAVVLVRGADPLNVETAKQLGELLEESLKGGQPRVVFDLAAVPLIDSAGLELLLHYRDRYRERGGALKLSAPSSLCRDILAVTDVCQQIEIFDDRVAAVGSFVQ